LRPESRGTVSLSSADPYDDPAILANFLSTEEDRRAVREGVHGPRGGRPARARGVPGAEFAPGEQVQTDEEIDAFIRAKGETIYHPVGTAWACPPIRSPWWTRT
jgi:choline dehydrogenase